MARATRAARSFTADATVAVLESVSAETGRWPANIRMDNGTELTAHAMRDWCRLSGIETAFIEPGSAWQNGFAESFNGRFRDEFLICEQFDTLLEAQVLAEDWRIEYNTYRPHGSLGDLTPRGLQAAVDRNPTSTLITAGPQSGAQSEQVEQTNHGIALGEQAERELKKIRKALA